MAAQFKNSNEVLPEAGKKIRFKGRYKAWKTFEGFMSVYRASYGKLFYSFNDAVEGYVFNNRELVSWEYVD